MFTLQNNIAVLLIADAHHSNMVVEVVEAGLISAPELHQHRRKPVQAPSKTAQAGKGGEEDMERGGRRPGIEISTLKHL